MTTTNNPARAATAGELNKYRNISTSIFTARINQGVFGDSVDELTYDNSVGTFGDVKAGAFVWVGSGAGLKDKGVARVRTTADATKIYINPVDDIAFADNDYLTVYTNPTQAAIYGLAIQHPTTVYTARINQSFSTLDRVTQLTYDGGSGTLANVLEGMTVFIGSGAGLSDKGVCRVRKTPTATILYIGETSNIQFANDDYITIVDSFSIWARPTVNNGGVILMDTDIEHGDLTRGGIIPRLAPQVAVIQQTSGTITFTPCNPNLSAGYDGATIDSYLFEAPSASTTSNMTNPATAEWTYPTTANQEYRWSCTITDSLTRETVSYRRVFVNPDEIPFTLNSVTGDFESGGWSFEVTAYSDLSTIYDRALVTLYVKDYFSGRVQNIGKLTGYENIVATGWIDGESIVQDSNKGTVTFTVYSAAHWLEKIHIDPLELNYVFTDESNWTEIEAMTIDKILARLLYWQTTAPLCMDCFFTGDTKAVRTIAIESGGAMSAINSIANRIFARGLVNSYGQLFIDIDSQIADSATQANFPVVLDITTADYEEPLELERRTSSSIGMVQLGGLQSADGVTDIYLYSRAPGNVPNQWGGMSTYDDYIVQDAADCRRIAGVLLAMENNMYESITLTFPSTIRLFDIAPRMVATITTTANNPTDRALTAQRLIPRRVSYVGNKTVVTFELEVNGVDGIDYFPPTAQDDNLDEGLDGFDGVDFPAFDAVFPETVPPEVTTPCNRALGNSFTLTFNPRVLTGSTSTLISRAYFPCKVRATGGTAGDTKIILSYHAFGDAETNKACYAVNGDTRVITGTWSGNVITFSPVSDTEITGFEIEINAGAGATISRYEKASRVIEEGEMGTATTACVVGNWYAIEAYTGYWTATFPAEVVGLNFYNTYILPGNSAYDSGVGLDGFGDFHLDYDNGFGSAAAPANATEAFNVITQEFDYDPGTYGTIFFNPTVGVPQAELVASATLTLGSAYQSMRWRLFEAKAIGRQLVIGAATLYNVCALD